MNQDPSTLNASSGANPFIGGIMDTLKVGVGDESLRRSRPNANGTDGEFASRSGE